jgi:hypothetical protein
MRDQRSWAMKKMFFLVAALSLLTSACLPASLQPEAASPVPLSEADLQATAAMLSQLTLEALPTPTLHPSSTPVVVVATNTETASPTATIGVETSTVVLASETPGGVTATGSVTQTVNTTLTATLTLTPSSGLAALVTETAHPIFYGTLPPDLPSGSITIINKSRAEVYISLQCTTPDGYRTILEYPVPKTVKAVAPAGKYVYVIWVGGKKLVGSFGLSKRGDVVITVLKDSVRIK